MADAKIQLANQQTGLSRYIRTDFRSAGQNSWQDPPTQNEDEFELLTNVLPAESGNLERRWGYTALNTSFFSSPAVDRAVAVAVYQDDSANTRKIVWPAITGIAGIKATTEAGATFNPSIYTSSNAVPRATNSRNYGYFISGHASDTPTKWNGAAAGGTSKWGIIAPADAGLATTAATVSGTVADDAVSGALGSQGPSNPGTAANVDVGGADWTNPNNILILDGSLATSSVTASGVSDALKATNFGFTIPTGVTIAGIVVEIFRHQEASGGNISDGSVLIVKGGATTGTGHAAVGGWPTLGTNKIYGSSSDLWGAAWTAADINASNFGVQMEVSESAGIATAANVDSIRITVYYTSSNTIVWTPTGTLTTDLTSSNNVYAVATMTAGSGTHALKATNFGFAVPTNAIIGSVTLNVEGKSSNAGSLQAIIYKGGVQVFSSQVTLGTLTASDAVYTNSVWNTVEFTPTDVNDTTFGVGVLSPFDASAKTISIDYLTLTITYTTPLTITSTAGAGAITLVSGRKYFYVYSNSTTGHTSGLSPVSASSGAVTTKTIALGNIADSTDTQVDAKIILATADGGDETLLYELATIDNGAAVTTYTDNTPEDELLTHNIYLELNEFGDEIGVSDNDPPVSTGQFPTKHRGRMYLADGQTLYFSKSQDELTTSTGITVGKWEEAFPPDYFFDISEGAETIAGLMSDGETLYIGTERRVIRLLGDSPSNFQKPETLFQNVGILNQDVWKMVFRAGNPLGAMWITPSNKVVISDFNTYEDVGWPIQDVLDTLNKTYAAKCWAIYSQHSIYNLYILALVTGANTQPDTLCVYDIEMKRWYIWTPSDKMLGGLYHIDVTGVPFTYLLAASGKLYKLDPSVTQDRTDDTPLNFDVTIQTGWLDFGDHTLRKVLNELEVMTGDSSLAVTIQGASNISEFTTPAAVATSAALTTGPLGEYKVMLAGKTTKDRYYKLKFVSSGTSQVDVLDGFSLELFPLHRI